MRLPLPTSIELHSEDWRGLRRTWSRMSHLDTAKMTTRPPMSFRYEQTKRALWSRMLVLLGKLRREPVREGLQPADYYGKRNDLEELAARGATMDQSAAVGWGTLYGQEFPGWGRLRDDECPERLFTSAEITRGDADAWISRLWHEAARRTHLYRAAGRF